MAERVPSWFGETAFNADVRKDFIGYANCYSRLYRYAEIPRLRSAGNAAASLFSGEEERYLLDSSY